MLKVQEYLKANSVDQLTIDLGIKICKHPTEPLMILNYNQIESPKTNDIVRECRGLVLHSETFDLISRSFPRFFNWGEVQDEMKLFNFNDFIANTKEDGSLVVIYNHNDKWFANTRGSFGEDNLQFTDITWRQGFCQAMGVKDLQDLNLDKTLTYVCEFTSPYNKIVRTYKEPKMFLLTIFNKEEELSWKEVDNLTNSHFLRPEYFSFKSVDEIEIFLREISKKDPTFEGVVMCDNSFRRWKIKNPKYLSLHKMRGEGDNLYNPKNLLPFILDGETDELLTYFSEVREVLFK